MKKFIVPAFAILLTALSSCSVEPDCNCGTVLDDPIYWQNGQMVYTAVIRNNCSNRVRTFYLYRSGWMQAVVGREFCLTNVSSWSVAPFNEGELELVPHEGKNLPFDAE